MPKQIDTTNEAGDTDPWSPAGPTIVQVAVGANSRAVVEIQGRLDAAAPWFAVVGTVAGNPAAIGSPKLPQLRLVWRGNGDGVPLKAWSTET